jgi:hypothetical protein
VIQRIASIHGAAYRVVAYGGERSVTHSDFDNAAALMEAFDSVTPGLFAPDLLADESGGAEHRIVFARDMELDDAQLSALGLR